jgi:hypothetical protein
MESNSLLVAFLSIRDVGSGQQQVLFPTSYSLLDSLLISIPLEQYDIDFFPKSRVESGKERNSKRIGAKGAIAEERGS